MAFWKNLSLFGLVLVLGCSSEKAMPKTLLSKEKISGNRSNCILISSVQEGRKIDEYLIDNGMDGSVDLYLKCERDNYRNSEAYMSQYTFDRVKGIRGNSRLAYEIKHPENGKTIQISAETQVIDFRKQIDLDKQYRDNEN